MSRNPEISNVIEQIEELSYKPLPRDRELKAKFWVRASSDPIGLSDLAMTRNNAERLCQAKLGSWDLPGFQDWFFNKDEFRQKLEYSVAIALDALNDVLLNTDPKVQGARVQAIKVAMDLAGKTQGKQTNIQVNNQIGQQIQQMDKKQLEAYIAKSAGLLPAPEVVLDIEEET